MTQIHKLHMTTQMLEILIVSKHNFLIYLYYVDICLVCHAEYDAILSMGTPPVKECTLYVTKYPCNVCAKLIVQSGIKKIVYFEEGVQEENDKNYNMYEASRIILRVVQAPPLSIRYCT